VAVAVVGEAVLVPEEAPIAVGAVIVAGAAVFTVTAVVTIDDLVVFSKERLGGRDNKRAERDLIDQLIREVTGKGPNDPRAKANRDRIHKEISDQKIDGHGLDVEELREVIEDILGTTEGDPNPPSPPNAG